LRRRISDSLRPSQAFAEKEARIQCAFDAISAKPNVKQKVPSKNTYVFSSYFGKERTGFNGSGKEPNSFGAIPEAPLGLNQETKVPAKDQNYSELQSANQTLGRAHGSSRAKRGAKKAYPETSD